MLNLDHGIRYRSNLRTNSKLDRSARGDEAKHTHDEQCLHVDWVKPPNLGNQRSNGIHLPRRSKPSGLGNGTGSLESAFRDFDTHRHDF